MSFRRLPLSLVLLFGCAAPPPLTVTPLPPEPLAPSGVSLVDTAPKEPPRLVPPEVALRTYLRLFGGLAPLELEKTLRGKDGTSLFDGWDDYIAALGLPDHRLDVPRQTQTNAFMVATFERIGVALCDRALEHDWRGKMRREDRFIFAFDPPLKEVSATDFAFGFDILHRTFLGYPATLAPKERSGRFHQLFLHVKSEHEISGQKSRFTPQEAGWAAVCYGLIRHPEFQLY